MVSRVYLLDPPASFLESGACREGRLRLRIRSPSLGRSPSCGAGHETPDEVVAEDPDRRRLPTATSSSTFPGSARSTPSCAARPRRVHRLRHERAARRVRRHRARGGARPPSARATCCGSAPPQEPGSVCVELHFEPWVEGAARHRRAQGDASDATEEAVVVEGDATSTQAVTPDMIRPRLRPSGSPPPRAPKTSLPSRPLRCDAAEAGHPAVADDDPFFVGRGSPRASRAPHPRPRRKQAEPAAEG